MKDMKIKPFSQFAPPAPGTIMITLNTTREGLGYLTEKQYGNRYFSKDESVLEGEDVVAVQRCLNTMAGRPDFGGEFTCLAARISNRHRRQHEKLIGYGEVILVVDPEVAGPDLAIFNGDFKSMGHSRTVVSDRTDSIKVWTGWKSLDEIEPELCDAMRGGPQSRYCIAGVYFEARLYRALRPQDVLEGYFPDGDEKARTALELLGTVRSQQSQPETSPQTSPH